MEFLSQFTNVSNWTLWVIIAVVLFTAEVFIPGFWIASLAVGALGSALAAAFGLSLTYQLFAFAVTATISFFFLRPVVVKYLYTGEGELVETNSNAMIGKTTTLLTSITLEDVGSVKIGSEVWRAKAYDEKVIEKGERVTVYAIDGATLMVEPEETPEPEVVNDNSIEE
ncbi:NfeD family protein [bacterium]|nr:NfeD family protein [bacterium]